jgi:flagellar protein FlaJ
MGMGYSPILVIVTTILISSLLGGGCFCLFYTYPFYTANKRKRDIAVNLPFAINHMAAIASSGVPPLILFRLLMGFEEYGEISKEARRIIERVDVFGQDITSAIRNVAMRTPSKEFEELLYGIVSIITTGGDLKRYFKVMADKALFEYELSRRRYTEILSTYADFYTALLIAAPLFLIAILSIMNLVGGELAGMTIGEAMTLGVYGLIPVLNIAFLIFIHLTQPKM